MRRLLALQSVARGAACVLALLAGCGRPPAPQSDWERAHEARLGTAPKPAAEAPVAPPPYPGRADLVEFYVAATSGFRFFIDPATLDVDVPGGLVRYVLVARSESGAENVSFEAMRCETREVRLYATGQGGRWNVRPGEWRAIEQRSVQRWHNALYREFFCPQQEIIVSAAEAVRLLRTNGMRPQQPDRGH